VKLLNVYLGSSLCFQGHVEQIEIAVTCCSGWLCEDIVSFNSS